MLSKTGLKLDHLTIERLRSIARRVNAIDDPLQRDITWGDVARYHLRRRLDETAEDVETLRALRELA